MKMSLSASFGSSSSVVDTTSFPPSSSHPFNNTTAHAIIPEKQQHSGAANPHWISLDGGLRGFNLFWNRQPFTCASLSRTANLLCAAHGHVNSLHWGGVIRFASTSISILSNCCTATTSPDGMAHSGLSPEPISPQPAAT